jgi:hypothetical protein
MPLTSDQIKTLLERKPTRKRGKKEIDTSIRDHQTWFKLARKEVDENYEPLLCENPNCVDPRPPTISATGAEVKYQAVAEIKGKRVCRFCFFDGWLLDNPDQERLAAAS